MMLSSGLPLKLSSRPCNPTLHPDSLHCVRYKKLRWFICKQCVAVFFRVTSKPKIIPCCAMYLLHWSNRRNCLSLYSDGMGVNRGKRLSPYNDRHGGVKVKSWLTYSQSKNYNGQRDEYLWKAGFLWATDMIWGFVDIYCKTWKEFWSGLEANEYSNSMNLLCLPVAEASMLIWEISALKLICFHVFGFWILNTTSRIPCSHSSRQ
mgnify:CR=1 FL=1